MAYVQDVAAAAKGAYNSSRAALEARFSRQSSNEVLMVAPTAFTFNEQTAQDNHFMHTADAAALPTVSMRFTLCSLILPDCYGVMVLQLLCCSIGAANSC